MSGSARRAATITNFIPSFPYLPRVHTRKVALRRCTNISTVSTYCSTYITDIRKKPRRTSTWTCFELGSLGSA